MTNQTSAQLAATLYEALRDSAAKIQAIDTEYGYYAWRKVTALSANSDLEALIRAGKDIELIASKVTSS